MDELEKKRIINLFNLKKNDMGYIDKQDLITILKSLGLKICYDIFKDNKNSYNFDELNEYAEKFKTNYYIKQKIENSILFLNPDNITINKNVLKSILCENGNKFTDDEFKKFLINIPVNPEGNINHSDLVDILSNYVI
ncbi:conserved Plasmodium protein, unknown function [Plasmodium vinckei vinckei]|uniref:Uncharacterized protein n=1 Tax=Plasmodium vinckei vinckei TaxID=54757 RepID=A0A449BMN6_PLAVN|nr:conserved Plasmodium protein, unknown function [Plasmodium vinckei vinckei]VEV54685.1 conserved Plasmodium protein, unknown function [Plasmodium vinckei vinckei]